MTPANSLSIDDLITELKIGRATVKFILDRFSPWLSSQLSTGNHQYSPSVVPLLIRISELLSSGMLPSQIEEIIENDIQKASQDAQPQDTGKDLRMNHEALTFIRDMVSDISGHQGRIAMAHEKRAQAEERKAAAIEKRAEAEEKKAQAMNNIAMALEEMGRLKPVDAQTMQIAGQAAQALTMDEGMDEVMDQDIEPENNIENRDDTENWDDDFQDPLAGMEELLAHPEPNPSQTMDIDDLTQDFDDLSLLMDEPGLSQGDVDDLSSLSDTVSIDTASIDTVAGAQDIDTLFDQDISLPEPDDLSMLVDEISEQSNESSDMDELSLLLEDEDQDLPAESKGIDDLSFLIDPESQKTSKAAFMDDLSALVDIPSQNKDTQDNLWSLIDNDGVNKNAVNTDEVERNEPDIPIDDLSALVDPAPAEPSLKPDITPDQDLPKYKAAVMKIIIELKSKGLDARQTTDRLNKDEVPTLSGKPHWAENAIVKIYGFIDSAH